jgi:hypothetical protein
MTSNTTENKVIFLLLLVVFSYFPNSSLNLEGETPIALLKNLLKFAGSLKLRE